MTRIRNNSAEELTFTFASDKDCKSLFEDVDSHCLSNAGMFQGGKAVAMFFQNKKDGQSERLLRKADKYYKKANQTMYWHTVSDY